MSMKRKIAAILAAVSLMTAASGALADYGDKDKDNHWQNPFYKPGEWVEIYNTGLHMSTRSVKIMYVSKANDNTWVYTTYDGDDAHPANILDVTANDIQKPGDF